MKTYCLTNENHYWLLPAFTHLFKMFWPWQALTIAGYTRPPQKFDGVPFYSIAATNYPVQHWTNGLIEFLDRIQDEYLVLMLEDYWLSAPVRGNVAMLLNVIQSGYFGDKFLRLDLSADRASHAYLTHEPVAGFDIISTPSYTPYQMSFQAAVWHRRNLLSILVPGETPWEAEINGSIRLRGSEWLVLGTLQRPVQYTPVYRSKRKQLNLSGIPAEQVAYLQRQAWV